MKVSPSSSPSVSNPRRPLRGLGLAVALCVLAPTLHARSAQAKVALGALGSSTFGLGETADLASPSLAAALSLDWSKGHFGFGAIAGRQFETIRDDTSRATLSTTTTDINATWVSATGRYFFGTGDTETHPFLGVGLGYAHIRSQNDQTTDLAPGYTGSVEAGLRLIMESGLGFEVAGVYRHFFLNDDLHFGSREARNVAGFGLSAGVLAAF